jgi:putative ABC transport system substrate-binding protein
MNCRTFLGAFGLLTAPLASFAWAQSASRIFRIGYLGSDAVASRPTNPLLGTLLGRLQELGYVEGGNLVFERRTTEDRNERYRTLATELVNLKVPSLP